MKFICTPCKVAADYKKEKHDACLGGTWCDCQHRTESKTVVKCNNTIQN